MTMEELLKEIVKKKFIEAGFKNVKVDVWSDLDTDSGSYYMDADLNYRTHVKVNYKGLEVEESVYTLALFFECSQMSNLEWHFDSYSLISGMKRKVAEEAVRLFMED